MIKAEDYFKINEKEREKMRHKLIKKGQKFYQDIIEPTMTAADKGKFVVVEPETESYFIGQTGIEAFEQAESKCPDKTFYLVRVGFRTPYSLGGVRGIKRQS